MFTQPSQQPLAAYIVNPNSVTVNISGVVTVASTTITGPLPLPVSGVTPQLVTQTNPTTSVTIPTPVQVSGIVSLSPLPLPTISSGILPVNIVGSITQPVSLSPGSFTTISGVISIAAGTTLPTVTTVTTVSTLTKITDVVAIAYSGIIGNNPPPLPISGVYIPPINIAMD